MLKRISVGNKLNLLLFSAMLGVIIISALALHSKYQRMLDDRRATLKSVVQVAIGVLDHYDKQVKSGHMPLSAAQDQAKRTIGNLRYAGKEYYSLYDMHPRMVWHPIKPELNGKDLSTLKDPNGKLLVKEMRDAVASQGSGFVDYLWPQPGKDEPVAKLAYAEGFASWGWIVASGLYLDDLNAEFRHDALVFVGQIATAGLGITLTAASTMVFYSMDYSMSNYEQTRARIHRVGQRQPCTYIHLVAKDTVDEKVLQALRDKANLAKALVDDYRAGRNPFTT